MTPRLAVTREQAAVVSEAANDHGPITLHLPERPTMPCLCTKWPSWYEDARCNDCFDHGTVPIPEGARVDVGWWDEFYMGGVKRREWVAVATATLASVVHAEPDGPYQYRVVLTNVEAS